MFEKWRNLRLSMKIPKIIGVEDHLFEQIEKSMESVVS